MRRRIAMETQERVQPAGLNDFFERTADLARRRAALLKAEAEIWIGLAEEMGKVREWTTPVTHKKEPELVPGHHEMESRLLSSQEATALLGLGRQTLNKWRVTGEGPQYVKIGRRVYYSRAALDAFVRDRVFTSTSAYNRRP